MGGRFRPESTLADERSLAMVLNSLGGVQQRMGKFEDAEQSFQKSYELLIKVGDERGQSMVLNSMGCVYQRQRKFDKAMNAFEKSHNIGLKLNDQRHLAMVLTSWGKNFLFQKMPEQAIIHLKKSFDIEERLKNKRGLGFVTPFLCQALQAKGQKKEVISICQRALKIAPRDKKLQQLKMMYGESYSSSKMIEKKGVIKRILRKNSGYRFGFIAPEDGDGDIYFGEAQVEKTLLPTLTEGLQVLAEVEYASKGLRARRVWNFGDTILNFNNQNAPDKDR